MIIRFPVDETFESFQYPGGEVQVRIKSKWVERVWREKEIWIEARLYSTLQIIELLMLKDAISGLNPEAEIHLILPYLPYARADRRFVMGDCWGASVFMELLNDQLFNSIQVLDVHSPPTPVYGLKNVKPEPLIMEAVSEIEDKFGTGTILYPDEGARARYDLDVDGDMEMNWDTANATKKRDPKTGKLSGFEVPPLPEEGPILIVDDICDGGGTFLGVAGAIRDNENKNPLFLWVTHGIFSKGVAGLLTWFKVVYTTDSWSPTPPTDQRVVVKDAFEFMRRTR